ncbi:MAG: clostripain-related cysteine peptidase, partial [Leptolyngbyaceae cyanobacterium CAN_BIN12]|nr:clostripain-related cysteine peptidase [Leptolyngbyaceae cyanobacterium CAN_BIN12]
MTTEEKQSLVTDDETLWNVLIYMAADNNLKEECVYALTEIEKAGITPGIRIVAQLDSGDAINRFDFSKLKAAKGFSQLVTRRTNTILKAINGQEGSQSDEIRQKILSDKNAQSDSKMLGEFLSETIIEGHNMVVLSGHGSGAVGDFLGDDKSPSSLSIPTLKSVLESVREQIGHKINVLGMDSCLMSMVEVCYELRDQVEFLVGAEGFERNAGWPYLEIVKVLQANMKALKDDPQTALKEIVRQIVR